MKRRIEYCAAVAIMSLGMLLGAPYTYAEDLLVKDCAELIRLAQGYQQDLKTIDTVLGSAIDTGNMTQIKKYKLKKGAAQKQLNAVMKAISMKGCVAGRQLLGH